MQFAVIDAEDVGGIRGYQYLGFSLNKSLIITKVISKTSNLFAEVRAFDIADTPYEGRPILLNVEQMDAVPCECLSLRW